MLQARCISTTQTYEARQHSNIIAMPKQQQTEIYFNGFFGCHSKEMIFHNAFGSINNNLDSKNTFLLYAIT